MSNLESTLGLKKLIRGLLYEHRRKLYLAMAIIPFSVASAALFPYLFKVAIDSYLIPALDGATDVDALYSGLYMISAVMIGVVILSYVCSSTVSLLMQRAGEGIINDLRLLLYRRSLRLPQSYFDKHSIGNILTRITSDTEALQDCLNTGVINSFIDLITIFAYLAIMFSLNWQLTLLVLVALPVLIICMQFLQNGIRKVYFQSRIAISKSTGYLQECLSGVKMVQLYNAENKVVNNYKELNRQFLTSQNLSNFYDALLFAIVEGSTTIITATILWFTVADFFLFSVSIGVLVAFIEYIQRLMVPVREFSQQMAVIQRAAAALKHIAELTEYPLDKAEIMPETNHNNSLSKHFQSLVFKDVSFSYSATGPLILDNISFTLERGQHLALVGETGSGKTSIIRLIMRIYSDYKGSIKLNGQELRNIAADDIYQIISSVAQNVFLFRNSLYNNISMGADDIGHNDVMLTIEKLNINKYISDIDKHDGLESEVSANSLSMGQLQLISLARAMVKDRDLVIMDEATSSIDSATESAIQRAIEVLYEGRTVITIAHRLSTIRQADEILVIERGRIIERGRHTALVNLNGKYAELLSQLSQPMLGQASTTHKS